MNRWRSVKIFFVVSSILVMFLGGKFFLKELARERYQALLAKPEWLEAFRSQNEESMQKMAERYSLEYQRLAGERVVFETRNDFPDIRVIPVNTEISGRILKEDMLGYLRHTEPYLTFIHGRPYFFFVVTPVLGRGDQSYLIYRPLFL